MPQDIAGCIVKRKKIIPIAMPTPPTEQTASNVFQEVYNTPEIRQRIVSYLPERSLNRIGTLEKRFYADVARELFHEVTFREVCKMRRDTVSMTTDSARSNSNADVGRNGGRSTAMRSARFGSMLLRSPLPYSASLPNSKKSTVRNLPHDAVLPISKETTTVPSTSSLPVS